MSNKWFLAAAAVIFAAVVGVIAYNSGFQHGMITSGKITVAAPPVAGAYPYPYPYYGWHGGFFFFPFLFILFVFFFVRAIFWRSAYYRGGRCGPHDSAFDEWHRRAHERMSNVSV